MSATELEYVNWLYGSSANHCKPTASDVKYLSQIPALWTNAVEMQIVGLKDLGVLMDERQWSEWMAKHLKGKRAAKALNSAQYKT